MWKDRIEYFLRENIYPNIYAFHAQRKIKRKIELLKQEGLSLVIPPNKDLDLDAFSVELKEYQNQENDRGKVIDDKAKSSLIVVTLSITVMLAGLNFIKDAKITFGYPLFILVLLGVTYLVISGITAVKALNISEFFTLHPDDWLEQGQDKPTIIGLQRIPRIKMLYAVIKANELALTIRTNFVDATFIGIRNGITLLALAFIIAVGNIGNQVRFNTPPKNDDSEPSSSSSNSKQGLPSTSPIQGYSTQETPISNNNQSEANMPKTIANPDNEQSVNSSKANSTKGQR
ncbi:MAG TPA: hypothetical protein VFQ47_05030 [Nitrososphaera sp.]|jgi:hypothetical protein|nr:hypothetical protein [Nitrososphaera sp.]